MRNTLISIKMQAGVHGDVVWWPAILGMSGKEANEQTKRLIFGSSPKKVHTLVFSPVSNMLGFISPSLDMVINGFELYIMVTHHE